MSAHHCHALGCKTSCPPRMLMCRKHWGMVRPDLQREVYRTVGMRGSFVDASWAPWWRAQAQAIAYVANLESPNEEKRAAYLERAKTFADGLESRTPPNTEEPTDAE